jgi:hypothetical protein
MKRLISKKNLLSSLVLSLFLFGYVGVGNAVVITFDDVPGAVQNGYGPIGLNYHGFDFGATNQENRMDWIDTVGSSFPYGAHSGDFTMLNNYGGDAIITQTGGGTFTFTGLWIKGWSNASSDGYVEGIVNSVVQYHTTLVTGSTFGYVTGSAAPIDQLRISASLFLVDDLELNGQQQSLPEPGTFLLLGLGLMGLAGVRKRLSA